MIGTVVGAIFVGLIVGALARLILPGKQKHRRRHDHPARRDRVIRRVLGNLQAGVPRRERRIQADGFLVGIIVAMVLISIYVGITGRRGRTSR